MAFMQAYIESVDGYMVMDEFGDMEFQYRYEDICPLCGTSGLSGEVGDRCSNCGAEIVEEFKGFAGGLSAPGYMDQTDPIYGETMAEVAEQLLYMYFDEPEEDMDEDELADLEWLEGIAAGSE